MWSEPSSSPVGKERLLHVSLRARGEERRQDLLRKQHEQKQFLQQGVVGAKAEATLQYDFQTLSKFFPIVKHGHPSLFYQLVLFDIFNTRCK